MGRKVANTFKLSGERQVPDSHGVGIHLALSLHFFETSLKEEMLSGLRQVILKPFVLESVPRLASHHHHSKKCKDRDLA
jgi:hypothetical protein